MTAAITTGTPLLAEHADEHLLVFKHLALQLDQGLVGRVVPSDVSCRLVLLAEVVFWNHHVEGLLS